MWNGNSDDVVNRVMKGLCDLAIIAEPHNAEGVESISVYQEPWVAMIPAHHPLACADGAPVRLEELLPKDEWIHTHHAMIFFGRYKMPARAKNPDPYSYLD